MKRRFLLGFCLLLTAAVQAQLNIQSGATFLIENGSTVAVAGDVTSASDITGTGTLLLNGTTLQHLNMKGKSLAVLQVDNTAGIALTGNALINQNLNLVNGKMSIDTSNLSIAAAATITGYDNTKYIVTGNTGQLIKVGLGSTAFEFPVGFDASTYNPLSVTQNGTSEDIGIRVLQDVLTAGTSGSAFVKEVVDASWVMTESDPGNNNFSLTASWAGTDTLPGFNRNKTGLSNFDGTTWDLTNSMTGPASGTGPFTVSRSNVTAVGAFAVGTRPVLTPLLVAPKTFLQGAYNTGTGMMNDNLRAAGLIPTTEPYTGMSGFTQSGSGGGETVPSALLSSTGTGNDIVDWVFAELRDGTTGAVISTRAVLLQRNGQVVDVDGTNAKTAYINFAGELPNNYYVSIRHRNHLGVRTPATLALAKTSATTYDFSSGASQAQGSVQATLASGVYGMYAGNSNGNSNVRYSGPANDENDLLNNILGGNKTLILSNVYSRGDFNMNGTVRYSGPSNDENVLLNAVLGGVKTRILTQGF